MLTERHRALIQEIYECTPLPEVYSVPGGGLSRLPGSLDITKPVLEALNKAFDVLNQPGNEARAERVIEILDEYSEISLDPSSIDREGYKFRFTRNLRHIRELLFPYLGVYVKGGDSGMTPMG